MRTKQLIEEQLTGWKKRTMQSVSMAGREGWRGMEIRRDGEREEDNQDKEGGRKGGRGMEIRREGGGKREGWR